MIDFQGLTFREICAKYNIGDSTLRGWIEEGVCGSGQIPTRRIRGKETKVLMPEQLEKLERFLLYRSWFSLQSYGGQIDIDQVLVLHVAVEEGDLKRGISKLNELKEILDDALEVTKLQLQILHAKLHGDEEIDPNDVDLEY